MLDIQTFQSFINNHIPLVRQMQLKIRAIDNNTLQATAPIGPNINDKATVFGGSSSALMTICGWSLIKYNLERNNLFNDVVIYRAQTHWQQAQSDDLVIEALTIEKTDWHHLCQMLKLKNRSIKVSLNCRVLNQAGAVCTTMKGDYVVLENKLNKANPINI